MEEKVVVTLIETSGNGVSLMANSDKTIAAAHTIEQGLAYFEKGYNTGHARSYEASMSAAINNMFFSPSIIEFDSFEHLVAELFGNAKTYPMQRISNVSGMMTVFTLADQEKAKKLWDEGHKPKLIGGRL